MRNRSSGRPSSYTQVRYIISHDFYDKFMTRIQMSTFLNDQATCPAFATHTLQNMSLPVLCSGSQQHRGWAGADLQVARNPEYRVHTPKLKPGKASRLDTTVCQNCLSTTDETRDQGDSHKHTQPFLNLKWFALQGHIKCYKHNAKTYYSFQG